MQNSKTINLTIDSKETDVSLAGLAIRGICTNTPFSETDVYQIELSVVEAVTNIIKHAYNGEAGKSIDINLTLCSGHINFKIYDTGNSFELKGKPEIDPHNTDIETLPESGMGLFIIHAVMDEVRYETCNGKNILTLSKYFDNHSKQSDLL